MTKAELLHRFRWVFLILPFATAAGFRVMGILWEQAATGRISLPSSVYVALTLLDRFADLAILGWLILTLFCSARTAYMAAAGPDGKVRGAQGNALVVVLTCGLALAHLALCALLFVSSFG